MILLFPEGLIFTKLCFAKIKPSQKFLNLQYIIYFFLDRYKVMLACWEAEAEDRPTFSKLVEIMGDFLEDNVKQVIYV